MAGTSCRSSAWWSLPSWLEGSTWMKTWAETRWYARSSLTGAVTFVGGLYRDAAALALAHAYQQATDFHRRRPPIR